MNLKITINLLFSLLLFSTTGFAQYFTTKNPFSVKKYAQFLEENSKVVNANKYQTLEKVAGKFILKTYNPDKLILTQVMTFKDIELSILDGPYLELYDDGSVWKKGQFFNNATSGVWEFHYPFAGEVQSGEFLDGKKEGSWIRKDSLDRTMRTSSYLAGQLEGELTVFDKEGNVAYKEFYEADELVKTEIQDSLIYKDNRPGAVVLPAMPACKDLTGKARESCREYEYMKYVYGKIKYPNRAVKENIEGTAIVSFLVEKDGSLSNFTVLRGICKDIEKECMRVIKSSPTWIPGQQDGELVRVRYNMPIKFKLE
ncbi:MAG: TonB family protein [Bacteroidota bacterium]